MKRALDAGARCVVVLLGITGGLCLGAAPGQAATGTSNQTNPTVVFSTPGVKQVTLSACNGNLCAPLAKTVTVLDPKPAVTSAGTAVLSAEVGQLVRLVGTGTGKPPLSYAWQVTPPTAAAFNLNGSTAWWDTSGMTPGVYQVALGIGNAAGSASSATFNVALVPEQPSDFYTLTPCRAYDSRNVSATGLMSGSTTPISVTSCGVPSDARAIAGNLTVVGPTAQGVLSIYPGNYPQPSSSTINFNGGNTRANSIVMPLATDGSGTLSLAPFVLGSGTVHVIVDITGYFKPAPVQ